LRRPSMFRAIVLIAAAAAALSGAVFAQSLPPAADRGWSAPRMADGVPDLQGVWQFSHYPDGTPIRGGVAASVEAYAPTPFRNGAPSLVSDPPIGRIPYQPAALARKRSFTDLTDHAPVSAIDPNAYCSLQGVPRSTYMPNGIQILQVPGAVVVLGEFNHNYRFIATENRPRLSSAVPLYMGDSHGRWEGDVLVVEVSNLNGKPWLDSVGNFTSASLRVVERWSLLNADTLLYEATLFDPTVYARPWTMSFRMRRERPGYELMEHACHEGERSFEHIIDAHPEVLKAVPKAP
jgi:hypothetical protein